MVTTLGTTSDEQRVDALIGEHFKNSCCTTIFRRSVSARLNSCAVPGGAKSVMAISPSAPWFPVLPAEDGFPYTITHRRGNSRVQRLDIDGDGVRRIAVA